MEDLVFYNVGCEEGRDAPDHGPVSPDPPPDPATDFLPAGRAVPAPANRLDEHEPVVRATHRNVEILTHGQELAEKKVETFLALGWDHVAMVRRLAVLEDQIAVLTGHPRPGPRPTRSSRRNRSLFPGLERRSKVAGEVCLPVQTTPRAAGDESIPLGPRPLRSAPGLWTQTLVGTTNGAR